MSEENKQPTAEETPETEAAPEQAAEPSMVAVSKMQTACLNGFLIVSKSPSLGF